jgi:hypothetical protein
VSQRQTLVDAALPQGQALVVLEDADAAALVAHVASDQGWIRRFADHLCEI